PAARRVRVGEGYLEYDRAVVAPGVEFQWELVEGLAENQDKVLHAWKAGPQTQALAEQMRAMPDGGVFVLSIPPAAYRCPPGPYERACQVAWYLKQSKPRSKLVILDANQNIISKTALFRAAWREYPNIDYRASNKVVKVDPGAREVTRDFGDTVKYDVVNTYRIENGKVVQIEQKLTPGQSAAVAQNSLGWARSIWNDVVG